ncbi:MULTISPECIES: hypothetical protein [Streptomyces]|uniref:hypothetical protein n=1 Tax=Streptomyces TaxID=1883 RepID=UPI0006EB5C4F|nr:MULTISPECIES: hypothetical protein [Streptomyces]MCF3125476.1 hypothetical protein [Streptomyces arenae]
MRSTDRRVDAGRDLPAAARPERMTDSPASDTLSRSGRSGPSERFPRAAEADVQRSGARRA